MRLVFHGYARVPGLLFLPIETSGDAAVNVYSRVQMMMFKARRVAREEFEQALAETAQTEAGFRRKLRRSRPLRSVFGRPAHRVAGEAANLVYAIG